jgi:hypothetical protein
VKPEATTGGAVQLSVLGFEYAVAFRVWSAEHGIIGRILSRCHEEARFVRRLCVLEAPFKVDVAIHVVPLLPTLLLFYVVFIKRLYGCAEDLREFLRYDVVLCCATGREDSDSPGFCIVESSCADFDVVACIVLGNL